MDFNKYLSMGIKDLISEFPKAGKILEEYDIGCVPCSVGTCKFMDIIDIHNLNENDEYDLMKRIFNEIYPGQDVVIPKMKRKIVEKNKNFSPPIEILISEHNNIKKLLNKIPLLVTKIKLPEDSEFIQNVIYFIKNYADKFHHAKEENILFKYFDETQDIIKAMYQDHITGRDHVKRILDALDKNEIDTVKKNMLEYGELLLGHIKKEDEILYPWMDRELSISQIGQMYNIFMEIDNTHKNDKNQALKFLEEIEDF